MGYEGLWSKSFVEHAKLSGNGEKGREGDWQRSRGCKEKSGRGKGPDLEIDSVSPEEVSREKSQRGVGKTTLYGGLGLRTKGVHFLVAILVRGGVGGEEKKRGTFKRRGEEVRKDRVGWLGRVREVH